MQCTSALDSTLCQPVTTVCQLIRFRSQQYWKELEDSEAQRPLKYRIAVTIVILAAAAMALVLWQTLSHFQEASRSQLAATEQVIVSLVRDISRPALLPPQRRICRVAALF